MPVKKVDRVMPKGDYLRPPGAVGEVEFLSLCTRCDECIKACPAKAIRRSNGLMDVAIGTPVIVPKGKSMRLVQWVVVYRSV